MESTKKKMGLSTKILLGFVLGLVGGLAGNFLIPKSIFDEMVRWVIGPIGTIFLNGIKMVVVPLVLFSLISGAAAIGDPKKLGRVGGKILGFYLCTTLFASALGIIMGILVQPGVGINTATDAEFVPKEGKFIMDMITGMVSTNPVKSMADGDMLQILVFAVIFGIALASLGEKGDVMLRFMQQGNEIMMKFIGYFMLLAPYAIFCLMMKTVGQQGLEVILPLAKYVVAILIGLVIHALVVYGATLKIFTGMGIFGFVKRFFPVMSLAFSTQASNACIPLNIETMEKRFGVPRSISSFTIPLGATVNMDGSAILQGVAALFIAQSCGVNLSITQMVTVVITATLASIGAAGMPGTALIMLTAVVQSVGLPIEAIPILLSVDRIVDMFRTTLNVMGDAVGTYIVAKTEGEIDEQAIVSIAKE